MNRRLRVLAMVLMGTPSSCRLHTGEYVGERNSLQAYRSEDVEVQADLRTYDRQSEFSMRDGMLVRCLSVAADIRLDLKDPLANLTIPAPNGTLQRVVLHPSVRAKRRVCISECESVVHPQPGEASPTQTERALAEKYRTRCESDVNQYQRIRAEQLVLEWLTIFETSVETGSIYGLEYRIEGQRLLSEWEALAPDSPALATAKKRFANDVASSAPQMEKIQRYLSDPRVRRLQRELERLDDSLRVLESQGNRGAQYETLQRSRAEAAKDLQAIREGEYGFGNTLGRY